MNQSKDNRHVIDILFVIALFGIFVLSATFLISIGAGIYSKTMLNMTANFNSRTAVAYIIEKVRQSDTDGGISLGQFDGHDAIVITNTAGGREYTTYIYEYDGRLKELMVRSDVELTPESGQDILEVSGFSLKMAGETLMKCEVTMENGDSYSFYVNLHSKAEVSENSAAGSQNAALQGSAGSQNAALQGSAGSQNAALQGSTGSQNAALQGSAGKGGTDHE